MNNVCNIKRLNYNNVINIDSDIDKSLSKILCTQYISHDGKTNYLKIQGVIKTINNVIGNDSSYPNRHLFNLKNEYIGILDSKIIIRSYVIIGESTIQPIHFGEYTKDDILLAYALYTSDNLISSTEYRFNIDIPLSDFQIMS